MEVTAGDDAAALCQSRISAIFLTIHAVIKHVCEMLKPSAYLQELSAQFRASIVRFRLSMEIAAMADSSSIDDRWGGVRRG